MVIPGMQDAHIHPISGGIEASACDLNGKSGAQAYVATVKAYAEAHPDEPWILGGGWLMSAFGPGAMPSKELLDAVVPDRPVYLSSTDGHTTWVNSKALEIAGITRDTPDPADGRIDRDPKTGEAIGSLQEGAGDLVGRHVPPWSQEKRIEGLRYSQKMLNGYGITAVQDASVREPDLEAYAALDAQGGLSLKAVVSQRLMKKVDGKGRVAAIEILMNSPLISDLILKGEVHGIKEIMAKSNELGMKTFDQALFDLYEADLITFDDALRNADSQNELRLRIKLEGKAARGRNPLEDAAGLRLEETEQETGFLR
jgi:hypothetical protein